MTSDQTARKSCPPLGVGLLSDLSLKAIDATPSDDPIFREQEARLVAFAKSRGLPVSGPTWALDAIIFAAFEHPDLNVYRRGRGRPKSKGTLAALGRDQRTPREREADNLARAIEAQRRTMTKQGHEPPRDVEVIRALVMQEGTDRSSKHFETRVANKQSELSKARSRLGIGRKLAGNS